MCDTEYHCVAYYMLPPPQQYFVSEKAIEMWDEHPVRVTIVNRKWRFGYETQDLAHTFPWGQKKLKRKYSLVRYPNGLNNNDTDDIYDLPLDADPEESWQVFACWTMEDGGKLKFSYKSLEKELHGNVRDYF